MEDGDEPRAPTSTQRRSGGGRLSWSKRGNGQGHERSWANRFSLGVMTASRRRDRDSRGVGTRSPPSRRTSLGGAMREVGYGSGGIGAGGGVTVHQGRHPIRYKQAPADGLMEDLKQEECLSDPGEQLKGSPGGLVGQMSPDQKEEHMNNGVVEEDTASAPSPGAISESRGGEGDNGYGDRGREAERSDSRGGREECARDSNTSMIDLSTLEIDEDREDETVVGADVSPSSELRPAGSISPSRRPSPQKTRQRTQSWAPSISPPVLSGPFSRARSKSRSPRHSVTVGRHQEGPGRIANDSRAANTTESRIIPTLARDISNSTLDDFPGLNEGDEDTNPDDMDRQGEIEGRDTSDKGDEGRETSDGRGIGPFTHSSSMMARLRLPHMELGFEEDGFFGIDPRQLIIGREIARGAYGVVYEAVLYKQPQERSEDSEHGDLSGETSAHRVAELGVKAEHPTHKSLGDIGGEPPPPQAPPPDEDNEHSDDRASRREQADPDGQEERGEAGGNEDGDGGQARLSSGTGETAESGDENGKPGSGGPWKGTSVAVKIQQVPMDEEEQANLLGELAMLRNHAHPHLVEFIGAAIAVERGLDTVMVAMELCTNGALREALKLNISWPLKVRIARDMTDGLQYLHGRGIIHRDIKTPNVLIDAAWRGKLCDYNFAIDENSTIKQEFCAGTAEFMSPEVLLSEEYGLLSDVFSLGMIMVEMQTGKEPSSNFPLRTPQDFFAVNEEEIQEQLLEGCPSSFSLLQSQCLFAEVSERPTAEDAHGWLQDLVNELNADEVPVPEKGPPLPVLTEGAAIAREGNVINASPKGTEHPWVDNDALEEQLGTMVEDAVERALAERATSRGLEAGTEFVSGGDSGTRLDDLNREIQALRNACEERDSRISDLEVQALRNASTLKMLSSALEVAYKMLEAQQAINSHATPAVSGLSSVDRDMRSDDRSSLGQDSEDLRSHG